MIRAATIAYLTTATFAGACEFAVCQVNPDSLSLMRIITFEDQHATMGPGHLINGSLTLKGAAFSERFVGQAIEFNGDHDRVTGPATNSLTLKLGDAKQNISLVIMSQNRVLNGYGPTGFPRRNAQGEGAIAVLFEQDQAAIAFDVRGGENGSAFVQFLRRDGSVIAQNTIRQLGEYAVGFHRKDDVPDIAGFVLMNSDPQGLAIDNIRFDQPANLS